MERHTFSFPSVCESVRQGINPAARLPWIVLMRVERTCSGPLPRGGGERCGHDRGGRPGFLAGVQGTVAGKRRAYTRLAFIPLQPGRRAPLGRVFFAQRKRYDKE